MGHASQLGAGSFHVIFQLCAAAPSQVCAGLFKRLLTSIANLVCTSDMFCADGDVTLLGHLAILLLHLLS